MRRAGAAAGGALLLAGAALAQGAPAPPPGAGVTVQVPSGDAGASGLVAPAPGLPVVIVPTGESAQPTMPMPPGAAAPSARLPTVLVPSAPAAGAVLPGLAVPGDYVSGVAAPGMLIPGAAVPDAEVPGTSVRGTLPPSPSAPGAAVSAVTVLRSDIPDAAIPGAAVPKALVPSASAPTALVPGALVPSVPVPSASVPSASVPRVSVPGAASPGAPLPSPAPGAAVPRAGPAPATDLAPLSQPKPDRRAGARTGADLGEPSDALPKVETPSPPPGRFILQHPQAVDSATLAADGRTVALNGIVALPDPSGGLQRYLRAQGDEVACDVQGAGYACVLPDGTDVALVSLANGAARATADAPKSYREQEAAAQAARRGVWASLPPPPVTVPHPAARTSALLATGGGTYPLNGLQGLPGRPAQEVQGYIAAHGDSVTCQQQPGGRTYVCTLPDGTDIAMVALVNGVARLGTDASESYRVQQDQAVANRRGIWATGAAPPPAVLGPAPAPTAVTPPGVPPYPPPGGPAYGTPGLTLYPPLTESANPPPGVPAPLEPGGIAVLGGQPTAIIDGEQAFFVFGGAALGWGYWDHLRHWHGAPDRYANELARLRPFGRPSGYGGFGPAGFVPGTGLGGFGPGQPRYAPSYAPAFVQPGPISAPPVTGQPAFAPRGFGQPGFGVPRYGQPVFEQPAFGRPAFGQRPFARPGFSPAPFGRPGFAPAGGRSAPAFQPGPALPATRPTLPTAAPAVSFAPTFGGGRRR